MGVGGNEKEAFLVPQRSVGDQKLKPESGESQVFRQGQGEARRGHLRAVGACITADLNCDSLAHSRYLYVLNE